MNLTLRILSGILGGIPFAVFGALLIVTALLPDPDTASTWGGRVFLAFWACALILAVAASRPAKVWRRLLIGSGLLAFLSPVTAVLFTGTLMSSRASGGDYAAAEAAGHVIGGGLLAGLMGFVGFFLGAVLVIAGVLIGRDKPA